MPEAEGDLAEHRIARRDPVLRVHRAEPVHVQEDDSQRMAVPACHGDLVVEALEDRRAARHARHWVDGRRALELAALQLDRATRAEKLLDCRAQLIGKAFRLRRCAGVPDDRGHARA